jgi:protein SCO1
VSENSTEKSGSSRLILLGVLLVGIVAVGVIGFSLASRLSPKSAGGANDSPVAAVIEGVQPFDGVTAVDPPRQLHDFTLTNQNNSPTSLSDFKGRFALMLFGYTHCPDVCPLTLLEYKKVKNILADKAGQVVFVFISIDGERDTPSVVADFVARFDPTIVGLTGDEATLRQIGTDYDLYFAKQADASGSTDNYLMDHTANTFLVDRDRQLVALYTYGTDAAVIANDIEKRLVQ